MKAIIVEDSKLARTELKHLLKSVETVEIIGEAENAEVAKEKIEKLVPDLIFLDIHMPGKTGFDLLEDLEYIPRVIFTTAYDEYAIQAFEHNALDYLQKPVKMERLVQAVEKVQQSLRNEEVKSSENKLSLSDQVFVKDGENCWFIDLSEIRHFEVYGNYTRIHFEDQTPLIPRSLSYMESRLDEKYFFRANRQEIINLKWIEKIEPWFSGTIRVYLKGGQTVDVSRRQSILFKEIMSF